MSLKINKVSMKNYKYLQTIFVLLLVLKVPLEIAFSLPRDGRKFRASRKESEDEGELFRVCFDRVVFHGGRREKEREREREKRQVEQNRKS